MQSDKGEVVVTDFGYLSAVAAKFGRFYLSDEFKSFVKQATAQQLRELAEAYEAIDRRNDAYRISRWLDRCFLERKSVSREEFKLSRQVGQLFVLFDHLEDSKLPPFSSGKVTFIEKFKKPNWNNLPEDLGYLREPAEHFGSLGYEAEMIAFLGRATDEEMEWLARTSEQIRVKDHIKSIETWMDRFAINKHQEAWLVYCLLGVLDHAGLLDF